jgi:hypothetical protein
MSERTIFPQKGSPNPNEVVLSGHVTIGSSGAVSSQTGAQQAGFTVTQDTTGSAVGRYLVTFYRTFSGLKTKHANMTGPAAGSAFPTTTGINPQFRDYSGTAAVGAAASVQFTRNDTMADANPASGTILHLTFVMQN